MDWLLGLIIIWLTCGGIAAAVALNRGLNGCLWFGVGALFGPLGIIFAFIMHTGQECPHCRKQVHREATRCPHCQADLRPAPEPESKAEPPPGTPSPATAAARTPSFCGYCGQPYDASSRRFCSNCGAERLTGT